MGKWVTGLAALLLFAGLARADTLDVTSFVNVPIPDNSGSTPGTASTSIGVGVSGTITDLNVDVIIEHTWQGDLIIELEKVGGPTVTLMDRPGVPQSTFGFATDNLGNPTTGDVFLFDDEAAAPYDVPTAATTNVVGAWQPEPGSLSTFDGLDMLGTWILHVSDNASGDIGSIKQFSLHFTTGDTGNQNAPVPEPGTLALVLAAGGLVLVRRRRRRLSA